MEPEEEVADDVAPAGVELADEPGDGAAPVGPVPEDAVAEGPLEDVDEPLEPAKGGGATLPFPAPAVDVPDA